MMGATPSSSDVSIDASVVICAYTLARWDDLVAAVASLERQTIAPREVIVVVDHNDELLDMVRGHLPRVVAIENTEQRGLSGARNSGIALAQGRIIAFLDDDAVADPDWLAIQAAAYRDPAVVGVGGSIEPLWPGSQLGWFPDEFAWVVGCTYRGMPTTTAPVRNLIGCNMSFRREVFDRVARFRSGVGRVGTRPVGCEETELCIRVGKAWPDKALLYEPRAVARHRVSPERATWRYFRQRCFSEGLSKAQIAAEVGSKHALRSEMSYTTRVLPQGILRNVRQALLLRHSLASLAQAGAIAAGLAITVVGYGCGKLTVPPDTRPTRAEPRREAQPLHL